MMKKLSRNLAIAMGVILLAGSAGFCAPAPLSSSAATVALSATLPESLAISVSANSVDFGTLTSNSTTALATPLTITTTWTVASSRGNVYLTAWFANSTQALAGTTVTTDAIPSSAVEGSVNSGAYTAFTQSPTSGPGVAGASLNLFTTALNGTNRYIQRSDTLGLEINLTGLQVPADTYTGTLNIQAQAL